MESVSWATVEYAGDTVAEQHWYVCHLSAADCLACLLPPSLHHLSPSREVDSSSSSSRAPIASAQTQLRLYWRVVDSVTMVTVDR